MKTQASFHFIDETIFYHAGKAATTRRHLGSSHYPRPPSPGRPLATGVPESNSPTSPLPPKLAASSTSQRSTCFLSNLNPLSTVTHAPAY